MKTWKEMAADARKAGYQPGGPWELRLRDHIKNNFPKLAKELGKDLPFYLQVTTFDATELQSRLRAEGTDPFVARELALEQLLRTPGSDEEGEGEPEDAELAGSEA